MRVVLADDDSVIRSLIRSLLSETCDVVAQAGDGQTLVQRVSEHCPDIAVVDIAMPIMSGIEATRAILRTCNTVKVIMLSVHDERAYLDAAFEAGARGYVLKFAASKELIPAIEAVSANRRYVSTRLR